MKQSTLAATGFEVHHKATRKAEFLARMDRLIPWAEFCKVIEPFYPKAGNGRPPIWLERMLRMYFIAHWFNLADAACEDALRDLPAFRELPLSSTPCTANTFLARSIPTVIMFMDFPFRGVDEMARFHDGACCRPRLPPQPRDGEVPFIR